MDKEDQKSRNVSRRTLIASAALVPVAALSSVAQSVPRATTETALSAPQRKTVEAFLDRLVPKDELGPGAVECGAANYIDQSLAGALAEEKTNFLEGLAAMDTFAHTTQGAPFADLAPPQQDAVLTAMESGTAAGFPNARAVFARFRRLTLEGMFSDPHYGGNQDFAGWDLIRYPGPRVAVSPAEQRIKVDIKPYRHSAYGGDANGANNGH
jgi:gluconate 2-dehydrogenase gamma chain